MGRVAHSFRLSQTASPPNAGNTPDVSLPRDFPTCPLNTPIRLGMNTDLISFTIFFWFWGEHASPARPPNLI